MYNKYYLVKGKDKQGVDLPTRCWMGLSNLSDCGELEFIELADIELAYMAYEYLKADRDISLQEFIWKEYKHKIMRRK